MPTKKPKDPAAAFLALVDELGELERQLAPYRPKIARVDVLRSAIRHAYDDRAPEMSFDVTANDYVASIGARAMQNSIDQAKLARLDIRNFKAHATVTFTRLVQYFSRETQAAVVTTAATGPRGLTVYPR